MLPCDPNHASCLSISDLCEASGGIPPLDIQKFFFPTPADGFPSTLLPVSWSHMKNPSILLVDEEEDQLILGLRRAEERASPMNHVCIIKQQNGLGCSKCFFFCGPLPPSFWSSPVLAPLTIFHGAVTKRVTNPAPLCFSTSALFVFQLRSTRCSNGSHLFRDTCCQLLQR